MSSTSKFSVGDRSFPRSNSVLQSIWRRVSWRSVDRFRRPHIRQQASIPFLLLLETNSAVLHIDEVFAEHRDHVGEAAKRRSQPGLRRHTCARYFLSWLEG